jgi:hypothetical protein
VSRRILTAAGVWAVCLFGALPAHAASCPKLSASVDSGTVVDYSQAQPDGAAPTDGKLRFPGHYFEATSILVLTLRDNTINVAKGTIFKLTCYGTAKGAPLWPAVDVLVGSVRLATVKRHPAGVITEEGLFDPRGRQDMRFYVNRMLTSTLTEKGKMRWFARASSQPTGTTTVESRDKDVIVGVTPYVGSRPGRCRYVKSARLTTEGRYGNGSASYVKKT